MPDAERGGAGPGPQPCGRCGEITQTVLRWIEDAARRTCALCKRRPAEGIEPLCVQCLRREARKRSQELREARQREQGKLLVSGSLPMVFSRFGWLD